MAKRRLEDSELREIKEIFSHFDRDKSGTIDPKEFASLLDALGAGMSHAEIEVGLREVDRNHNGQIEFREFVRWWSER